MPLRVDILTLFCELFEPFVTTSIVGRAVKKGLVDINLTNFRDFATDKYGSVDDCPFGGGPGMVLMCQPIFDAVEKVRSTGNHGKVIMMTPQGRRLDQPLVEQLVQEEQLVLLAGHYEGFDERIRSGLVDMEVSLGDFVVSGGEIPIMALVDAMVRLLPGALGKDESTTEESFQQGLLEYPHYTRPREFDGMSVPEVLLNGNHARIDEWRLKQAEERTRLRRPDMWEEYKSNKEKKTK
ncbi:MAG: tRNA (guanosine(37)-N1)-methyltransferase TrmD [Phycisphaerae bacterium]|nr:tRNA (guanosine(37)-N1)-methyltransferase TrmD [Phycisphaerae bacterium]